MSADAARRHGARLITTLHSRCAIAMLNRTPAFQLALVSKRSTSSLARASEDVAAGDRAFLTFIGHFGCRAHRGHRPPAPRYPAGCIPAARVGTPRRKAATPVARRAHYWHSRAGTSHGRAAARVPVVRRAGARTLTVRRTSVVGAADLSCYIGSSSKISTANFPSLLDRNGRPPVKAFAAARSSASTIV